MTDNKTITHSESMQIAIADYITDLFVDESDAQKQAFLSTIEHDMPRIELHPQEGQFLMWLAKLIGAKQIVEIGTLAGYSALWLARALPPDGRLITLELEEKHARVAVQNFENAGVSHLIDLMVGDAMANLNTLEGMFDMVFIDADKSSYLAYLDWALEHVRPGGVITAHNALRGGTVTQTDVDDGTATIQAFNRRMAEEPRLLTTLYPAGDGTVIGMVLP